jgi:hypothetical protein
MAKAWAQGLTHLGHTGTAEPAFVIALVDERV